MTPFLYLFLFTFEIALVGVSFYIVQRFIKKDYAAFLALGPGGTPSTPRGYLRICYLKLFTLRDPFLPPGVPPTLIPQRGILEKKSILPKRRGERPKVVGLAPQRQTDQRENLAAMYPRLAAELRQLTTAYPQRLFRGTSCFEKHSEGVFSNHVADDGRDSCRGEVCHAHPSDGSMHLTLHPADVETVLATGWGQRHPLARDDCWWWRKIVPRGFVMVYAPRDPEELRIVVEIVRAAAWWIGGVELKKEGESENDHHVGMDKLIKMDTIEKHGSD